MNKKVWDLYAPIYERALRMKRLKFSNKLWIYTRVHKMCLVSAISLIIV